MDPKNFRIIFIDIALDNFRILGTRIGSRKHLKKPGLALSFRLLFFRWLRVLSNLWFQPFFAKNNAYFSTTSSAATAHHMTRSFGEAVGDARQEKQRRCWNCKRWPAALQVTKKLGVVAGAGRKPISDAVSQAQKCSSVWMIFGAAKDHKSNSRPRTSWGWQLCQRLNDLNSSILKHFHRRSRLWKCFKIRRSACFNEWANQEIPFPFPLQKATFLIHFVFLSLKRKHDAWRNFYFLFETLQNTDMT